MVIEVTYIPKLKHTELSTSLLPFTIAALSVGGMFMFVKLIH